MSDIGSHDRRLDVKVSILDAILLGSKLLRSNLSIQIKHLCIDVDIMIGERAGFLLAVSFFFMSDEEGK